MNIIPKWNWPDARGWIGIGVFALTIMLLRMMKDPEIRGDEFFQTIATVIIATGWGSVVSWAYAATKGGGELADKNADLVKQAMPNGNAIQEVEIVQPEESPVPVTEKDK